jgi:hypothetical protein
MLVEGSRLISSTIIFISSREGKRLGKVLKNFAAQNCASFYILIDCSLWL